MGVRLWSLVLFYGIAQGLVLSSTLVFNRRGRKAANLLLSCMLLSSISVLLPWWLGVMGWIEKAPASMYLAILLGYALGPLYYAYTKTLLFPEYKPRISLWVLAALLPGAIRLVTMLLLWLDADIIVSQVNGLIDGEKTKINAVQSYFPLLNLAYQYLFIYLALRVIIRTRHRLLSEYTDGVRPHINILKVLAAGLIVFSANKLVMWSILLTTHNYSVAVEIFFSSLRCLFIQLVAFVMLFLPEGFSTKLADLTVQGRRAVLQRDTADRYLQQLIEYMESSKPYLEEDLRLAKLAERLKVPPHVLSQVINEKLKINFFDLVNRYRVEEAKSIIDDPASDRYTLLGIARTAGFACKASFNRAFKKHAGMSPSQYRSRRGRMTEKDSSRGDACLDSST